MPPTVRKRISFLLRVSAIACGASFAMLDASAQQPNASDALKHQELHWAPQNVDAPLPGISTFLTCPLSAVLQDVGARAVELTANLENFTAREHITYIRLGEDGAVQEQDSSIFDYTFGFETRGASRASQEYRTVTKAGHPFVASGQDTGLAALPLIFLPTMQGDYQMSCEGVDKWRGQLAYVIHFAQRKDKPPRTLVFRTDKGVSPLPLRGRAWISLDNAQVLHLETNLLQSIPALKLRASSIAIDYGPVQLQSRKIELWLPQYLEAYWEYEKYRVMLSHTLTNFQVFSVETQEKVSLPNVQ